MKGNELVATILATVLFSSGCESFKPVTVTGTATFTNSPDVAHTASLTLPHTIGRSTPRIVTLTDRQFTYLTNVTLDVAPAGVSEDAFVLQSFSRPSVYLSDDAEPDTTARLNMGFVDPFVVNVTQLVKDAPALDSPTSITAGPFTERQSGVHAFLARWGEGDGVLPWTVSPPCPPRRTVSVAPPACFDLSFLVTSINAVITAQVAAAINPPPGGGADPDLRVRGGAVAFAGYVPNIVGALDAHDRRVRGFALIYAVSVDVRALASGNASDTGSPYNRATIWIPIGVLFESNAAGGIQATIDPVDLGGASSVMASRVGVEVFPSGPLENANAMASILQTTVTAVISAPPPPGSVAAMDVLEGFFNSVRPAGEVGENFDVLMMPEPGTPAGVPVSVGTLRYQVLFME